MTDPQRRRGRPPKPKTNELSIVDDELDQALDDDLGDDLLLQIEAHAQPSNSLPEEEDDSGEEGEFEEDLDDLDTALPSIERDEDFEREIEEEISRPVEELLQEFTDPTITSDPVRMYLREIGRTSLLTGDEEIELALLMRQGKEAAARLASELDLDLDSSDELALAVRRGHAAQQRLTNANLRLVVSVAKRYMGRGIHCSTWCRRATSACCGRWRSSTTPRVSSSAPTPPGGFARPSAGPSPTRRAPSASRSHGGEHQPPGAHPAPAGPGAGPRPQP
jgi:hypothetical protein